MHDVLELLKNKYFEMPVQTLQNGQTKTGIFKCVDLDSNKSTMLLERIDKKEANKYPMQLRIFTAALINKKIKVVNKYE